LPSLSEVSSTGSGLTELLFLLFGPIFSKS
jgi:hypothetical protein